MINWRSWKIENVLQNRTLAGYPEWRVCGVWETVRNDGLKSAHKSESPYCFWSEAMVESMRLADKHIPLGAELLDGMRSRDDPHYGPLWED